MAFHTEVLSLRQMRSLRRLGPPAKTLDFYLGGGTAIALRLGHRRSVDFDWFRQEPITDPLRLASELKTEGAPFVTGWTERGTLYGTAQGIRVSFFEYRYKLLQRPETWAEAGCLLASLADLACMKLAAVAQRGSRKDFVDLYAIGSMGHSLPAMLEAYQAKYGVRETGHLLYALVYFDDADAERMPRMIWKVSWPEVKRSIRDWVRQAGD
jgi:hypothetical protein